MDGPSPVGQHTQGAPCGTLPLLPRSAQTPGRRMPRRGRGPRSGRAPRSKRDPPRSNRSGALHPRGGPTRWPRAPRPARARAPRALRRACRPSASRCSSVRTSRTRLRTSDPSAAASRASSRRSWSASRISALVRSPAEKSERSRARASRCAARRSSCSLRMPWSVATCSSVSSSVPRSLSTRSTPPSFLHPAPPCRARSPRCADSGVATTRAATSASRAPRRFFIGFLPIPRARRHTAGHSISSDRYPLDSLGDRKR